MGTSLENKMALKVGEDKDGSIWVPNPFRNIQERPPPQPILSPLKGGCNGGLNSV